MPVCVGMGLALRGNSFCLYVVCVPTPHQRKTSATVSRLLAWYPKNARDLPWRRTRDPYAIWVSEIMLQQTQVQTVIPYWERWIRQVPTVQDLAGLQSGKLHKLWEGLGYYTRVRNLQRAARIIVKAHDGEVPWKFETLLELPGIGRYTAGAICSIAFDQPTPILDGNVIRVLTRAYAIGGNPDAAKLSGINIKRRTMTLFMLMGVMTAIAGIVYTSRLNAGTTSAGQNAELDAIASTVIGGTSLMGGEGTIIGAVIGAVLTSLVGLVVMLALATSAFGLSFVVFGLAILPFLLVLFLFKRWLEPLVIVVPLVIEALCFITVTTLVARPRPDVPAAGRSGYCTRRAAPRSRRQAAASSAPARGSSRASNAPSPGATRHPGGPGHCPTKAPVSKAARPRRNFFRPRVRKRPAASRR